MDSNTSFVLNVRRETSRKLDDSGKQVYVGGFDFHIAADITWTFKQFSKAICDRHAWNVDDAVQFSYSDKDENIFVKVANDVDLSLMFAKYIEERSVIVQNDVVIRARATSECPETSNQAICSQPCSSKSRQILALDDDEHDEIVLYDNEGERLYLDLVQSCPMLALGNRPA